MTFNKADDVIFTHTEARLKMCEVKGPEYADSADRLANFKEIAAETGTTPEQVLLVYLSKHLRSIRHFIKGGCKQIGSEPIEGRIMDAQNYLDLLVCLLAERKEGECPRKAKS